MRTRSSAPFIASSAITLFMQASILQAKNCQGFIPVVPAPPLSLSSSSSLLFLQPQQLGSFEALDVNPVDISKRRVVLQNWLTRSTTTSTNDPAPQIDFNDAWNVQKDLVQQHVDRLQRLGSQESISSSSSFSSFLNDDKTENDNDIHNSVHSGGVGTDTVILLQHAPVYTLGTASDESFIRNNSDQQQTTTNTTTKIKIPTVRMDRGGEVTYHGPGQLTVYPILDLRGYHQDIHWYCRALEEAVCIALADCGIVTAYRDEQTTGVWVDNHKVAAVGIKCRKWITQHGVAINVEESSLEGFSNIVPCGLEGCRVGCINQFLDESSKLTVREFAPYMESALEEVFCMRLV
jgi:lipoyl(octanoyl) transferase